MKRASGAEQGHLLEELESTTDPQRSPGPRTLIRIKGRGGIVARRRENSSSDGQYSQPDGLGAFHIRCLREGDAARSAASCTRPAKLNAAVCGARFPVLNVSTEIHERYNMSHAEADEWRRRIGGRRRFLEIGGRS